MKKILVTALLMSCVTCVSGKLAFAETLLSALSKAYHNNSALNIARASVRISDEDIAITKSGYRPSINVSGSYSRGSNQATTHYSTVGSFGIQLEQKIFDGFVTRNSVAGAEMQARAQREILRNREQDLFLQTVQAYADVYAARRIAAYRQENLAALEEQVRVARARLEVGDGTRTDLAQSEAQRSQAVSQLSLARADLKSKEAVYLRVVGDVAGDLELPLAADNLPNSIDEGFRIASSEHPAILSSRYAVDAASHEVKVQQGTLLPRIDASASSSYNEVYDGPGNSGSSHSVGLRLSVPVYQGGKLSAHVRQSKEKLGKTRIEMDDILGQIREQFISAWSGLEGAKSSASAYRDSVRASTIALEGRIQENIVGQSTVLDVLNSRAMMIDSQVNLVLAQRDVIVAGYTVKAALGRLNPASLGLEQAKQVAGKQKK